MTTALPELDDQLLADMRPPCEAIDHLDPAGAPVRCDEPATWIVRTRCHCGHIETALLCDDCADVSPDQFLCDACSCLGRATVLTKEAL
jgi:hypothetical protein